MYMSTTEIHSIAHDLLALADLLPGDTGWRDEITEEDFPEFPAHLYGAVVDIMADDERPWVFGGTIITPHGDVAMVTLSVGDGYRSDDEVTVS